LGVLGEAEPGVEDDAVGAHAGDDEFGDAVLQFVADVADDIRVVGEVVHSGAVAAPVHGDVVDAAFGDEAGHAAVGEPAGDVVDEYGADVDGGGGGGGVHGVDADGDVAGDEFPDDGQHARLFF